LVGGQGVSRVGQEPSFAVVHHSEPAFLAILCDTWHSRPALSQLYKRWMTLYGSAFLLFCPNLCGFSSYPLPPPFFYSGNRVSLPGLLGLLDCPDCWRNTTHISPVIRPLPPTVSIPKTLPRSPASQTSMTAQRLPRNVSNYPPSDTTDNGFFATSAWRAEVVAIVVAGSE
jgi:hypothetical protein